MLLVAAVVSTLAAVVPAVWLRDPPERPEGSPGPGAGPGATSLREYDASGVVVPRTDFCDRIPREVVEERLGPRVGTGHYGNGDTAAVASGVEDVSHEYNCTFTGADGARLRAWVFAPPVNGQRARVVARSLRRDSRCNHVPGAPALGAHSVALVCGGEDRGASLHGLLGDAWLSCSWHPGDGRAGAGRRALVEQAGAWCVDVLAAIRE